MRSLKRSVICSLVIALWSANVCGQSQVERNVVYGMYSGLALLMDVHRPERPNGYGIVCIAGSGWNTPLGQDAPPLKEGAIIGDWAKALGAAGYTVFAVNHRATSRFQYPAAVEDVQRAVRFVRLNAGRFGIDPNRIAAMGGSSGGHLAAMVGVLDGAGDPDDPDPVNRVSSKVQSVVALYGAFDLKRIRTIPGGPAVSLFLGVRPLVDTSTPTSVEYTLYSSASPITYVTGDDPPLLMFHGDADETVPFEQSQLMEAALRKAAIPVKFVPVPGGRHGRNFQFQPGDARLPDYIGESVKWFDLHLRKSVPSNDRLQPSALRAMVKRRG